MSNNNTCGLRKIVNYCNTKEKGLVQISSVIPNSYPGHILLSEDEGLYLATNNGSIYYCLDPERGIFVFASESWA